MNEQEIEFFRREAFEFAVDVTDNEGKAVDLKSYVAYFTIKARTTDPDCQAVLGPKTSSIHETIDGRLLFSISTADTENINEGQYYYDIVLFNTLTDFRQVLVFGRANIYNGVIIDTK